MGQVRGGGALATAAVALVACFGLGAASGELFISRASVTVPTQATGARPSPQATMDAPQPSGHDDTTVWSPSTSAAAVSSRVPVATYATERTVIGVPVATAPTGTDEHDDPNAVVIRMPDVDYGSGYHGDYGRFTRQTSPEADLLAAVASTNGCLIIGDSIASSVVSDLVADLRETLGATCVYDAWPGRATEGTANALLDLKRRYGLPRRVIVMSGTNDIFNPPLFEPQMDRIVHGIGPAHEILWLTTFDSRRPRTSRSVADERNTGWINDVIATRAARTPNMRLVDWDALFRAHPPNIEALLRDGVHPNRLGVDALVDLVRQSLG
ncbi:MAG: GDSL-type esterase/lipase family protein [Dermatophilaceae bacterium]